jgi:hypothetical protein
VEPLDTSLNWLIDHAPKDAQWWLIGSAAALLIGAELNPQDVDVVASAAVIERITGVAPQGRTSDPASAFHSDPFFRLEIKGGLPIEFMGDLVVGPHGSRTPLNIHTRQAINLPRGTVYVPEILEQIAIFETFGRPKDLAKAEMLKAICQKV